MLPSITLRIVLVLVAFAMLVPGQHVCASSFATGASNSIGPFLAVGELSLLRDGRAARPEMIKGAEALAATGLATELLKVTVREKRPNSDSRTSFPSGHTSAAFAMATVLADYHPKLAVPAYALAATIGWSRVEVGAHHWQDVAAGAALGYFMTRRVINRHVFASPQGVGLRWKW